MIKCTFWDTLYLSNSPNFHLNSTHQADKRVSHSHAHVYIINILLFMRYPVTKILFLQHPIILWLPCICQEETKSGIDFLGKDRVTKLGCCRLFDKECIYLWVADMKLFLEGRATDVTSGICPNSSSEVKCSEISI